MNSLPTLEMKQCGKKRLRSGNIQILFSNIFKIKDKILVNFSMASQND